MKLKNLVWIAPLLVLLITTLLPATEYQEELEQQSELYDLYIEGLAEDYCNKNNIDYVRVDIFEGEVLCERYEGNGLISYPVNYLDLKEAAEMTNRGEFSKDYTNCDKFRICTYLKSSH